MIAAATGGDRAALGEILRPAFSRAVRFGRAVGLSAPDAEDLASDVCERVVRSIGSLRDPVAFEAWFWTIARHRSRTLGRRAARAKTLRDRPAPHGAPTDEAVMLDADHLQVARAFRRLGARDRNILWLREVEGMPDEAIGEVLGMKPGAVRVAAMRARRRLADGYRAEEEA